MRCGIVVATFTIVALAGPPAYANTDSVFGSIAENGFADTAAAPVFEGPVPRAHCGAGSLPEPAVQGEVPLTDRQSGRSKQGYRCNLEPLGRYQGEGASWVNQTYGRCGYMATRLAGSEKSPGVQVVDASDPSHPRLSATLTSSAMMGTWESLKINAKRGLLAAVIGPGGDVQAEARAPGFFDVYDIGHDCAHPRLLASVSGAQLGGITFGHEGGWSPDGRTYWASLAAGGGLNAIDVSDPTHPAALWAGQVTLYDHGFSISADGNRLYMAQAGNWAQGYTGAGLGDDTVEPNGLLIIDVSEIQQRRPMPQIHNVGHVFWTDGAAGQMSIPVTYAGKPYLVFVDELAQGAARIIDISDEANPRIVSKLKLEIDMPQYADLRSADADNRVAVYNGHYCTADRLTDPTALACGYFESGIRVFDIRDPHRPREIAYFNPPAQSDKIADLPGSEHPAFTTSADNVPLSADWCSSPPRFVGDQLWVICQDNGFMALRFTNGAWPFPESAGADLGLPSPRACASRRTFTIHLRAPKGQRLRSARVYVNGMRVGVVQGERLRAPVDLRGLPRGVVRVRIVARMRAGRTIVRERRYRTCTASR